MLSILIPCFNEEKLLQKSYIEIIKSLKNLNIKNYEIIFIDDGSKDNTLNLIKKIKKINNKVNIFVNKKNMGLGYNFKKGLKNSKGKYFILIPSDNSHRSSQIIKIFKYIDKGYDLITTYYSNRYKQNFFRHLFTVTYTPFLNFIYGTNFKYFNGLTLYKIKRLKSLKFENTSFSYQIELFVHLYYQGNLRFKIIPTLINDRITGSKAFRIENSIKVIFNILKIFIQSIKLRCLNFVDKRKYFRN